ncbi:hypothetical protein MGYG_08307 [Nannizzia gypsea CBS 118893]|uniref:Uncharacterized protein n=1 Tax=Arthroderma gypseum (strain ATCC MYA-4604 / CBS 118893) TaxID=535722 RepID=E4V6B3_ARTGP|nr:hypothetical protein MGYG_08307 [Nannizzia gypsea CBS 118893]EFR05296.1 hypothetical protein MGYG_08307 [Nannizzia gypsea CBS 118893]
MKLHFYENSPDILMWCAEGGDSRVAVVRGKDVRNMDRWLVLKLRHASRRSRRRKASTLKLDRNCHLQLTANEAIQKTTSRKTSFLFVLDNRLHFSCTTLQAQKQLANEKPKLDLRPLALKLRLFCSYRDAPLAVLLIETDPLCLPN